MGFLSNLLSGLSLCVLPRSHCSKGEGGLRWPSRRRKVQKMVLNWKEELITSYSFHTEPSQLVLTEDLCMKRHQCLCYEDTKPVQGRKYVP